MRARAGSCGEVVRQQWNFSPHGTTEEIEDYTVDLSGVTVLELRIDPDGAMIQSRASSMLRCRG